MNVNTVKSIGSLKMRSRVNTARKTMSKYYYSRDNQTFQECLLELLAIIATSYEEVDKELSFLRSAVLGEDKEQTKFR